VDFCASAPAAEAPAVFADPNKKVRIALVREVGEGGFMERYLAGAQSMADELGIELIESNARNDAAKMVSNIETAITQQVDAIIVDHGRGDALQPAIQQALEAGIKVATFDLVVEDARVPEIEQDDMQIGYTLSKQLAIDNAGTANVIYINVGGFAPLVKRDRAWQDTKVRYPGLNEVTQIGNVTDNTAADTQTRMEAALKENPDADVAIAMWDEFAKGAVRAVEQAGAADKVKVYSVDITNEDIGMMTTEGSPWVTTVATDSYNVGRLAVRTAAALVGGEAVEKYLMVQPQLITQQFLLDNNITNMDELVKALPALGESALAWYPWMCSLK
jgi:simple sugar transport system substrate-binding protein